MKPVGIFQHDALQAPGYLTSFLDEVGIPWQIFRPAEGDDVPRSVRSFSGLVFLGSDHSVNDRLAWIERELRLVGEAVMCDVPVLGHCFGGQLLARALGGAVHDNPHADIGWSRLRVTPAARALFGARTEVLAFNWHYQGFSIPTGARRTLFGTHCLNKGFVHGRHLAFQSHLEVTEAIVRGWCRAHCEELLGARGPAVQSEAEILTGIAERAAMLHDAARDAYRAWTAPLVPQKRVFVLG